MFLKSFRGWSWVIDDRARRLKFFGMRHLYHQQRIAFALWMRVMMERKHERTQMIQGVEQWAVVHQRR